MGSVPRKDERTMISKLFGWAPPCCNKNANMFAHTKTATHQPSGTLYTSALRGQACQFKPHKWFLETLPTTLGFTMSCAGLVVEMKPNRQNTQAVRKEYSGTKRYT